MDKRLELFFGQARGIGFSPAESESVQTALADHIVFHSVRNSLDAGLTADMDDRPSALNAGKRIALSKKEDAVMKITLLRYMASRPVGEPNGPIPLRSVSLWESVFSSFFPLRTVPFFALILVLVVGFGGAVSAAAEKALPGDLLYPVKLHVNEAVAAAFRSTPEAKARFDARLAETRMQEAAALAAEGRLDDRSQADLSARTSQYLQEAQVHMAALQASGGTRVADAVNADILADVQAHADAVKGLSNGMQADIQVRVQAMLADVERQNHALFAVGSDAHSSSVSSAASVVAARQQPVSSAGIALSAQPAVSASVSAIASVSVNGGSSSQAAASSVAVLSSSTSSTNMASAVLEQSSDASTQPVESLSYHSEYHSNGPDGSVDTQTDAHVSATTGVGSATTDVQVDTQTHAQNQDPAADAPSSADTASAAADSQ